MEIAVFARDVAAMPAGLETFGTEGRATLRGNCSAAAARMFVRQPELLTTSSALDVETEQLWEHLLRPVIWIT